MTWRWLDGPVPDDAVLALLTDSARTDLAVAGVPAPMLGLLAPQQARARLAGHAAAHPSARPHLLADPAVPGGVPLAGRMLVDRSAGDWVLVDLVVRPDLRGRGAGTWMLRWLVEAADSAGHPVGLRVRRGSPAQRLYARAGFVPSGADELDVSMRRAVTDRPADP